MPLGRRIARANKVGLNHITKPFAARLPGLGVVVHRGRKSGHEFRTPVNLFVRPGGFVVPLTYGRETDWVRNVVAAGQAEIVTRRRPVAVANPHIVHDEGRAGIPLLPRTILGWLDVDDFLYVDRA